MLGTYDAFQEFTTVTSSSCFLVFRAF